MDPAASADRGLHPLVIVTERESPEVSVNYLHVVAEWPSDGLLDYEWRSSSVSS